MISAAEARKCSLEERDRHLKNEINSAIHKGETSIYYPSRLLSKSKRDFMKSLGYEIGYVHYDSHKGRRVRISW